ncbi:MAG TPA: YXWGXW repeat-containing protein [Labilithrix sp.]|nr:YXWGXW repeat-containing protein [Labilithrix sp.]
MAALALFLEEGDASVDGPPRPLELVRAVLDRRAMRGGVLVLPLAVLVTAAAFACGSELPAPAYTRQPTGALTEVPYPPPPARVEAVPKRPSGGPVWIDGEWTWQTRRWAWKPGRWVRPPAGARFAPWTTVRDRVGTLYFAGGTWRNASGQEVAEPEPLAVGGPAPAAVVTPEGEEVTQGPEAPLDAGVTRPGEVEQSAAEAFEELDASRAPNRDGGATMDAESGP